jgi:hypothetical protein
VSQTGQRSPLALRVHRPKRVAVPVQANRLAPGVQIGFGSDSGFGLRIREDNGPIAARLAWLEAALDPAANAAARFSAFAHTSARWVAAPTASASSPRLRLGSRRGLASDASWAIGVALIGGLLPFADDSPEAAPSHHHFDGKHKQRRNGE